MTEETHRYYRMWNYFNGPKFDWYKVRDWPDYIRDMFLEEHKGNRERYRLFQFLTGNGMSPEDAQMYIMTKDVKGGERLVRGDYDAAAWRHFEQLTRQMEKGVLHSYPYFDMHHGAVSHPK